MKEKTMRDINGNDVPLRYVSKYDKIRDRNVRRILASAVTLRHRLENFVGDSVSLLDEIAQTKDKLGEKGNFSAASFDGLARVSIRQKFVIMLDERVARARELMLDYINGVLSRVDASDVSALRLIVDEAFRANASGILSTSKILSLLRMEVNSEKWREAKAILQDSLKPVKGKRYLCVEVRKSTQSDFRTIRLDIADCWPVVVSAMEDDKNV